jgi:hypothetical protein
MKKYTTIFLFLVALIVPLRGFGQDSSRYAVGFTPLQLLTKGWEDNFDLRIRQSNHWISFIPEVYIYSRIKNPDNIADNAASGKGGLPYSDHVYGFALGVQHKIYFRTSEKYHDRNYISYGLKYTYYNISLLDFTWKGYQDNGLNFYRYDPIKGYYHIQKLDFGFYLGNQKIIKKHFPIDIFTGLQYSFPLTEQTNMPGYRTYNTGIFDYAYHGLMPVLGVRLGYFWRGN